MLKQGPYGGQLPRHSVAAMPKTPASPDDLLTTAEAAAELGITSSRVTILITEGRLPAKRFGKRSWSIRRADLDLVRSRPHGVNLTDWRANTKRQSSHDDKKRRL